MGLDDITKRAQEMLNDQRVKDALNSEQAEGISDRGLDAASGGASKLSGGKFNEQIRGVRDQADKSVGNQ